LSPNPGRHDSRRALATGRPSARARGLALPSGDRFWAIPAS